MSDDKRQAAAVRRRVTVGGMAEASYGMATLERMRDEGLGDYVVLFAGPWSLERLREVVAFCRRNGMRFVMDEMWRRTQPAPRYIMLWVRSRSTATSLANILIATWRSFRRRSRSRAWSSRRSA